MPGCSHLDQIQEVTPSGDGCQDCLAMGSTWFHLRICLTCGKVGCCDESQNRHARAHWRAAGHPIMASFEPGENWAWCFEDQVDLEPVDPEE